MNLADHPVFALFSDRARQELLALCHCCAFDGGVDLFVEGDASDAVYLVLSGEVELIRQARSGLHLTIARIEPGDYFGDMGAIDGSRRCAGARTVGPSHLARIPSQPFLDVLLSEPAEVSLKLFANTAERLRQANSLFLDEVLRKEKLEFLGEMARSIIHDFKNQTMAVQLVASLLDRDNRDASVTHSCQMIKQQTSHMLNMAQEILEFSRGSGELHLKPVAINELFEDLAFMNADYLRRRQVDLRIRPIDAVVSVDKNRMVRALQNLIFNAADAFGPAGGEIRLEADVAADGAAVEVKVLDEGSGIPEEIRTTLFEPFVTAGKEQGLGLGLTIVRTIVEAHGASIDFDTSSEKGTAFRIRLPVLSVPIP